MKETGKKLSGAIKKINEAHELFGNGCCLLNDKSGSFYAVEQINFSHWMKECINSISKLVADCVVLEEL